VQINTQAHARAADDEPNVRFKVVVAVYARFMSFPLIAEDDRKCAVCLILCKLFEKSTKCDGSCAMRFLSSAFHAETPNEEYKIIRPVNTLDFSNKMPRIQIVTFS
jgi:hypothetical protein